MRAMALAAALSLAPISASAGDARWMSFEYREHQQVTIPCSAGLLCTVSFAPGEVLGDYFNSDPVHWKMLPTYAATRLAGSATAQLVAQAMTPGLRANFVIFARNTARQYRILFVSVADSRPMYASFEYNVERRLTQRSQPSSPARRLARKPAPKPPPTLSQIVDMACASQTDGYTADDDRDKHGRVDEMRASLRPRRICHDFAHTYIGMLSADTAVSDLPVPYEDGPAGVTQVNFHYFPTQRIFVVDTVANIVLRITNGKRIVDMHLRRTNSPSTKRPAVSVVSPRPVVGLSPSPSPSAMSAGGP